MRPLVAVRHATPYDPRFVDQSPLFAPLRRAARVLVEFDDFPPPRALHRVFEGEPPVHFVPATPRARRKRRPGPLDLGSMYDARITLDRVVPTRERSWHDLVNALVWGTFPLAKRALHARQHRATTERIPDGAWKLPPTRTREQDALALIDEGGVVVLAIDTRELGPSLRVPGTLAELIAAGVAAAVIFGHAVYESLVFGVAPAAVAAIVVRRDAGAGHVVREADAQLARALEDEKRFGTPDELTRVDVGELLEDGRRARL